MGTRADFYVGRGKDAEWIGSIAWDGYEFDEDKGNPIIEAKTEEEFVSAVQSIIKERVDGTDPEKGWPWPWEDSGTTDYAYAWDNDKVWVSRFGSGWYKIGKQPSEEEMEKTDRAVFPDMSESPNANVTLGKRSGLMIMQG